MKEAYLAPGEYFVGDAEFRVRTLLGSCVSVILWHANQRVGAISHFLLWSGEGGKGGGRYPDARYGKDAMEMITLALDDYGLAPEDCVAKVFGGGNMFPQCPAPGSMRIGRNNGEEACEWLQSKRIPIVSKSLFGVGHRQIVFDIESGDVWMKRIDIPGRYSMRREART